MIFDILKSKLKKYNPHLDQTIAEIGLSTRTYHCLRKADIWNVGDLAKLSWRDISGMRGAVRKTFEEVEKILSEMGLELRKDGGK